MSVFPEVFFSFDLLMSNLILKNRTYDLLGNEVICKRNLPEKKKDKLIKLCVNIVD